MSILTFREGRPNDAKRLAPKVRPADVEEISVITGATPLQVLLQPFGKPIGMAKICTILDEERVSRDALIKRIFSSGQVGGIPTLIRASLGSFSDGIVCTVLPFRIV